MSSQVEKDPSCLPCRLVGGVGLTGAGLYVASQVKRQAVMPGKVVVSLFAAGLMYTGVARLLELPPFGGTERESN